jgi:hypothetical protein
MKTKRQVYLMMTNAVVACLLATASARADALFSTESVTAQPGENNGSFQVLVTNDGSSPFDISYFEFEVTTSDSDLTFTESTTQAGSSPYVFAGWSGADGSDGGVTGTSTAGWYLVANDYDHLAAGDTLDPGATASLGTVYFDIAQGAAPGVIPISFNTSSGITNVWDEYGNAVGAESFAAGNVTATPEPRMMFLIAGLLLPVLAVARRRAKAMVS